MGSNGSKGKFHNGTQGSPQETFSNESVSIAASTKADQRDLGENSGWPNDLTRSMKNRLEAGENIINDHCKDSDYSAIRIESRGGKIYDSAGRPFNHIEEANSSIRGLDKVIKSLTNSLKNPNLTDETASFLKKKIRRYNDARNKLLDALKGE